MTKRYTGPSEAQIAEGRHTARVAQARRDIGTLTIEQIFRALVLEGDLRLSEAKLAEWRERFATSAHDAFRWAGDAVQAAARQQIVRELLAHLDAGRKLPQLLAHLADELRRRAGRLENSTSPMSNLTEECYRVELARVIESIEGIVRRREDAVMLVAGETFYGEAA